MSVNAQEAPPKRLHVAVDPGGNRKMTEVAPDAGPQPIPDEDLETVAGGGRYGVQFHDGCYIVVQGASITSHELAASAAQDVHASAMGHTNNDCTITQL